MDTHQLTQFKQSKKTSKNSDLSPELSLSMMISLPILAVSTNTPLVIPLVDTLSRSSDGVMRVEKIIGYATTPGIPPGEIRELSKFSWATAASTTKCTLVKSLIESHTNITI